MSGALVTGTSSQPTQPIESADPVAAGIADAPSFQAQGAEPQGTSTSTNTWTPTEKELEIFRTEGAKTGDLATFIENVKNAVDVLKQSDPAFAQQLGTSSPYSDASKVDQYLSEQFHKTIAPSGNPVEGASGGSARAADQSKEGTLASAFAQSKIQLPSFAAQNQGISQELGSLGSTREPRASS